MKRMVFIVVLLMGCGNSPYRELFNLGQYQDEWSCKQKSEYLTRYWTILKKIPEDNWKKEKIMVWEEYYKKYHSSCH